MNLASTILPATGVGEGFLYGVSQDGAQPAAQLLQPLGITAFRGGGHVLAADGVPLRPLSANEYQPTAGVTAWYLRLPNVSAHHRRIGRGR
jgi:hypothetical protein